MTYRFLLLYSVLVYLFSFTFTAITLIKGCFKRLQRPSEELKAKCRLPLFQDRPAHVFVSFVGKYSTATTVSFRG